MVRKSLKKQNYKRKSGGGKFSKKNYKGYGKGNSKNNLQNKANQEFIKSLQKALIQGGGDNDYKPNYGATYRDLLADTHLEWRVVKLISQLKSQEEINNETQTSGVNKGGGVGDLLKNVGSNVYSATSSGITSASKALTSAKTGISNTASSVKSNVTGAINYTFNINNRKLTAEILNSDVGYTTDAFTTNSNLSLDDLKANKYTKPNLSIVKKVDGEQELSNLDFAEKHLSGKTRNAKTNANPDKTTYVTYIIAAFACDDKLKTIVRLKSPEFDNNAAAPASDPNVFNNTDKNNSEV